MQNAGLYHEYAELLEMINAYHGAAAMGSDSTAEQLALIENRIHETGIDMDFHTAGDHVHPDIAESGNFLADHRHTGEAHDHDQHMLSHRHVGSDGQLVVDGNLLHQLEHYLLEMKSTLMP